MQDRLLKPKTIIIGPNQKTLAKDNAAPSKPEDSPIHKTSKAHAIGK